jgi:NAD+ diphosphatase
LSGPEIPGPASKPWRLDGLAFISDPLDRATEQRENREALARLRARPDARAILIARDMPVLMKTEAGLEALLPLAESEALGGARVEALLGVRPDGSPVFAVLLGDEAVVEEANDGDGFLDRRVLKAPGRDDLALVDLRSIAVGALLAADQASMLAAAKALMHWHARRRFCSNCGVATEIAAAGWRRECKGCGMQHFPRTDPVVIMLAVDGDDCLLGRQPRFPKGMYSALAGFVEPGETIEAAVRREIREEAGIACGAVRYFASQPWPFPASLMIGCFAQALSREVVIDRTELEDARWFSRAETQALLERRHHEGLLAPIPMAIAHHLVKRWTAGEGAPDEPVGGSGSWPA